MFNSEALKFSLMIIDVIDRGRTKVQVDCHQTKLLFFTVFQCLARCYRSGNGSSTATDYFQEQQSKMQTTVQLLAPRLTTSRGIPI